MSGAMQDSYGRDVTLQGQGGSIPLCTVFQETFPDAEIMLLGVEEPQCLIHAANESVDPTEIEKIALAEVLFMQNTRRRRPCSHDGGHPDAQALHGRGLLAAHGASGQAGGSGGAHGHPGRAGPDLMYFTAYEPIAITERITMLVLQASRGPALIVPVLERPDAEAARSRPCRSRLVGRQRPLRGDRQAARPARQVRDLGLGVGDARARPPAGAARVVYVSMTSTLPMLRAIKDAEELERLAAAGAAADACFEQIAKVRFAGRRESEVAADLAGCLRDHGHSEVDFTVVGSGPNGANPHHELTSG